MDDRAVQLTSDESETFNDLCDKILRVVPSVTWKQKAEEVRKYTGSSFEEIVGWFGGDVENAKLDE